MKSPAARTEDHYSLSTPDLYTLAIHTHIPEASYALKLVKSLVIPMTPKNILAMILYMSLTIEQSKLYNSASIHEFMLFVCKEVGGGYSSCIVVSSLRYE